MADKNRSESLAPLKLDYVNVGFIYGIRYITFLSGEKKKSYIQTFTSRLNLKELQFLENNELQT